MAREFRNKARIYEILDDMIGWNTRVQIRDRLLAEDLLPPFDAMAYYDRCTNDVIEQHGRTRTKEGDIQLRLFSIERIGEDGEVTPGYKAAGQWTEEEGIQVLEKELRLHNGHARKIWEIFDYLAGCYGKRRVERQLRLPMPERPVSPECAGAE